MGSRKIPALDGGGEVVRQRAHLLGRQGNSAHYLGQALLQRAPLRLPLHVGRRGREEYAPEIALQDGALQRVLDQRLGLFLEELIEQGDSLLMRVAVRQERR